MTRQEQNDVILRHVNAELRELPDVQTRVGIAFNRWFQSLVTPPPAPTAVPIEGQTQ